MLHITVLSVLRFRYIIPGKKPLVAIEYRVDPILYLNATEDRNFLISRWGWNPDPSVVKPSILVTTPTELNSIVVYHIALTLAVEEIIFKRS